jgi:hypothetical protein
MNNISAEGAQHLAQALHNNTVRQLVFSSTAYTPLSINIDTQLSTLRRTISALYLDNNFSMKKIICWTELDIRADRYVKFRW